MGRSLWRCSEGWRIHRGRDLIHKVMSERMRAADPCRDSKTKREYSSIMRSECVRWHVHFSLCRDLSTAPAIKICICLAMICVTLELQGLSIYPNLHKYVCLSVHGTLVVAVKSLATFRSLCAFTGRAAVCPHVGGVIDIPAHPISTAMPTKSLNQAKTEEQRRLRGLISS